MAMLIMLTQHACGTSVYDLKRWGLRGFKSILMTLFANAKR